MALSKIVADSVGSNAVTTAALSDSGVTAGSYGNTTAIPVITVDAKGRITSATTNSVSGVTGVSFTSANNTVTVSTSTTDFSANINASLNTTYSNATSYADTKAATAYSNATSYADTKAATAYSNATSYADTKAATAYTNAVAYAASNTYVNSTFAPLAGATFTGGVTVSNTIATGNNTITGFANITGSLTVGGVATITGNLVVNGTTITVNTSQINTTDSLMYLASNNEVSDSIDIGFAGHYNNGTGANGHTGFIRSAVTKKWYLFQNYQPEFFANNTVDVSNTATGIQMADLVVGNLVANSTLTVTGAATLSNTLSVTGLITGTITSANNADYLDGQHGSYYSGLSATAYSNATSYAATIAGTAYSNAITYAAANSYVNTQLGLKANLAGASFTNNVIVTDNKGSNTDLAVYNNTSVGGAAHLRVGYDSTYHLDIYRNGNGANIYYNATQTGATQLFQVGGSTVLYANTTGLAIDGAGTSGSGTPGTTQLRVYKSGTIDFTIGSDTTNVYLQSWQSKPLYINNQGNQVVFSSAVSGITTFAAGNTTITGFANVTSTLQTGGNITVGGNRIDIDNAGDNSGAVVAFKGSSTAKNFLIGNQYNVSNVFEITPSTTVGGTTFTTPGMVVDGNGNVGVGTNSPSVSLDASSRTDAIRLPIGTTAQRPTGAFGLIRANSNTGYVEYYDSGSSQWIGLGAFAATGGTITTSGSNTIHTFTSSGTFTVVSGSKTVQVVAIAGGGAGGDNNAGGGGAGGMVSTTFSVAPGNYSVVVGAGGTYPIASGTGYAGGNGSNTTVFGLTAVGGGGGNGGNFGSTGSGGSGGGDSRSRSGAGSGTAGQGNAGAANPTSSTGGGGGGAGGAGSGANGGVGAASSISGSSVYYAGGGGGGAEGGGQTAGSGGNGGGGRGGIAAGASSPSGWSSVNGENGSTNYGGGGGGEASGGAGSYGGNGGSGIVIIRY